MDHGEGGEKEEEQVDSREQILLSSEPAENVAKEKSLMFMSTSYTQYFSACRT